MENVNGIANIIQQPIVVKKNENVKGEDDAFDIKKINLVLKEINITIILMHFILSLTNESHLIEIMKNIKEREGFIKILIMVLTIGVCAGIIINGVLSMKNKENNTEVFKFKSKDIVQYVIYLFTTIGLMIFFVEFIIRYTGIFYTFYNLYVK